MSFNLLAPVSPPTGVLTAGSGDSKTPPTDNESTRAITPVPHNAFTAPTLTWNLAENWPLRRTCRFFLRNPRRAVTRWPKVHSIKSTTQKQFANDKCVLRRAIIQTYRRFEGPNDKYPDLKLWIL